MARSPYADAIAGIESAGSGGYSAVGPTHPRMGRALGRYQVMESNLPEWLAAAGLPPMTGDEFLASPQAQDAVFNHRFGQYVAKYGPEGAAAAWFAGEGGMNEPNRRDVLGTSVADYRRKFSAALGQPTGQPSTSAPAGVGGDIPSIVSGLFSGGGGQPQPQQSDSGAEMRLAQQAAAAAAADMQPVQVPRMQFLPLAVRRRGMT